MGQRNATYVIVQNGEYKNILPIYNQWNFIKLQSSKMVRGIKAVLDIDWKYCRMDVIPLLYFTEAGKNQSEWVGGNIETELYKDGSYTGAFQEDNNNGWNIVKFTMGKDDKLSVSIFCKVGSEDEDEAKNDSLKNYFFEWKDEADINYLSKVCKWEPKLETEASNLIDKLIYPVKNKTRWAI
jgi:hypothetical protein